MGFSINSKCHNIVCRCCYLRKEVLSLIASFFGLKPQKAGL